MPIYTFGSGTLWGVNNTANSTPQQFGVLQGIDLNIEGNVKELFGQYQFPVAVGRGTSKISGKAKYAQIQAGVFASLFLDVAPTTGQKTTANNETGTVPAVSTYTVTVANSATFDSDLGVILVSTGLHMKKVASAPATGEYSVAAGVYTFNAAQASAAVLISYQYNVAGSGKNIPITNSLIGTAPSFKMVAEAKYGTGKAVLTLNSCISTKLNLLSTKTEDWNVQEFDFSAFADASNNIGNYALNDAS